jgi:CHAT domain-containing protein
MARQMVEIPRRGRLMPIRVKPWLALGATLVLALSAAWLAWNRRIANDPARLIAQAYTEQRPFEFRIAGAGHAAVRLERGATSSHFQRPADLLEAEARIARELESDPENVKWLALKARAELLGWDPETSIATLQHAQEQKADDTDLLADLGAAYALRAETQNRAVDYGYAIEYLSRSLKARPDSPEALFNRAVVYERMYLYDDGAREWRRFLEVERSSAWREEAGRRLNELEQKRKVRQTALARISDRPELLLQRIADGDDVEPESYLDMAITAWLPHRSDDPNYERALNALAAQFQERHGDPWLRDVLAAPRSPELVRGLVALAEALKGNLADESERALVAAPEASLRLRAAGNRAGALRADVEHVYALHRAVETAAECVEQAVTVERNARAMNYRWILGQATLEEGNCRSLLGDFDAAGRKMDLAIAQVAQSGYLDLQLRAAALTQELQTNAGNLLAAWDLSREGLATYWSGPYPATRAHQTYFNLFRSAESLGQLQTAYVFGRAAAAAIAQTRHRRAEATTRARVARLASAAGWPEPARSESEQAGRLFDGLEQAKTDSQYRARAELNRAEVELSAGAPDAALKYLEAIRQPMENIRAAVVQIRFHNDLGDALWQGGRRQQAEQAYRDTIQLSEHHLGTLRGAQQRAGFMQATGNAYRSLLQLSWDRSDIAGAWRQWEWYRAGEMPGPRAGPEIDRYLPQLSHESFLSYAILPDGIVGWVVDDRGIEGHHLAVTPQELERTASRFLRECADPSSGAQTIRRDARLLYQWLAAPFAHRLDPARTLVIEPDGAIGAIPMQALMDENSRYVGERFSTTFSGGMVDYVARAGAEPASARTALVVAGPALGKQMSRTFPPLPQTLREGRSVAARFAGSVLLTSAQATLSALERNRPETELFHFAGHGFSNATNGGLLLAPEEGGSDEAGVLDGKRLGHQDWSRCRLAVLSACSTGTGEVRGPVNPESLVRNLLWAGVARVVATRWNVDAETDVLLMDEFYEALLSGSNVARSLQQAAGRLRENSATSHPYYWAAFQNFGTR